MCCDASDATLRHEVGEQRLIERYLRQQDRLDLQRLLTAVVALSLLLLLAYFRHYRRLSKQLDASHRQVLEQQQALLEANQQRERMSMTDGLTGLANRRRFDERVALEFALHRRTGRPLSVLMLDLDHFKQVNDQLGHAMGDEYLRRVASELKGYCRRPTDLLARYGGEEIICLLPETAQPEAIQIAGEDARGGCPPAPGQSRHPVGASAPEHRRGYPDRAASYHRQSAGRGRCPAVSGQTRRAQPRVLGLSRARVHPDRLY